MFLLAFAIGTAIVLAEFCKGLIKRFLLYNVNLSNRFLNRKRFVVVS